ncbi:hypothetical protein ACFP56_09000 [Paenibacillus septentrionalis]|uniref:Uncharacterized protein n=1 Tax=Paenibacillus septentrionalis TaxID=429342 RepID=A0ABW1V1U8_9BACL
MFLSEKWVYMDIEQELNVKYYIDSINDNTEGLSIMLSEVNDESLRVKVFFEHSVHAYRSTDESYRSNTINYLQDSYGLNFYKERTFFVITDSEYIRWLSQQSQGISDLEQVSHYSFLAVNSIVDVIAAYEPKITRL